MPAAAAASAISLCVLFGLPMSIASTSFRSTTRRQSVSVSSQPQFSANFLSFSALRAQATFITGRCFRSKNWLTCR